MISYLFYYLSIQISSLYDILYDMRKENIQIGNDILKYDIKKLCDPDRILFLDIETTGLSSASSYIYMIGMIYLMNGNWHFESIMAENASEEQALLSDFCRFVKNYGFLIHFNGNTFDLPFITSRCKANGIDFDFDDFEGIDLYKRISPYKHLLGLSNCKQKTIEILLGVGREDEYSGGELIHIYREYSKTHEESLYKLLFTHNHEDLLGMVKILPMLRYCTLFDTPVIVDSVKLNSYNDVFDAVKKELLIEFDINEPIPAPISTSSEGCFLSVKGDKGMLKVPVYHEELKFFFENHKDYYYLPEEDMAVHKSVSIYVDKEFRQQAKASTCYVRKESDFLPEWDYIFTPFFKREYDSKEIFFELSEELKSDRDAFSRYVLHILSRMTR